MEKTNNKQLKNKSTASKTYGQFYLYTFNKMIKSPSTYVIGFITLLPLWAYVIQFLIIGVDNEIGSMVSLISFFIFPLYILFITFKSSQVFRDEIEDNTLLSISSKPVSRLAMTIEGYLAVITLLVGLTFIASFLPICMMGLNGEIGTFAISKAALISITNIMIGAIITSIALLLSLKMKGRSFIGVMLGAFGTGFYILFGLMYSIRFYSSASSSTEDLLASDPFDKYQAVSYEYVNENDGSGKKEFELSIHGSQFSGAGAHLEMKSDDIYDNYSVEMNRSDVKNDVQALIKGENVNSEQEAACPTDIQELIELIRNDEISPSKVNTGIYENNQLVILTLSKESIIDKLQKIHDADLKILNDFFLTCNDL